MLHLFKRVYVEFDRRFDVYKHQYRALLSPVIGVETLKGLPLIEMTLFQHPAPEEFGDDEWYKFFARFFSEDKKVITYADRMTYLRIIAIVVRGLYGPKAYAIYTLVALTQAIRERAQYDVYSDNEVAPFTKEEIEKGWFVPELTRTFEWFAKNRTELSFEYTVVDHILGKKESRAAMVETLKLMITRALHDFTAEAVIAKSLSYLADLSPDAYEKLVRNETALDISVLPKAFDHSFEAHCEHECVDEAAAICLLLDIAGTADKGLLKALTVLLTRQNEVTDTELGVILKSLRESNGVLMLYSADDLSNFNLPMINAVVAHADYYKSIKL